MRVIYPKIHGIDIQILWFRCEFNVFLKFDRIFSKFCLLIDDWEHDEMRFMRFRIEWKNSNFCATDAILPPKNKAMFSMYCNNKNNNNKTSTSLLLIRFLRSASLWKKKNFSFYLFLTHCIFCTFFFSFFKTESSWTRYFNHHHLQIFNTKKKFLIFFITIHIFLSCLFMSIVVSFSLFRGIKQIDSCLTTEKTVLRKNLWVFC